MHVNRAKNGEPSTHRLSGVELRALRRLKRESIESPFVFVSERGSPFTTAGYRKMMARLGEAARFSFPVDPHMFRHACGYKLANDGRETRALQHYLGAFSIPSAIPSCRRIGSAISGATEWAQAFCPITSSALSLVNTGNLACRRGFGRRPGPAGYRLIRKFVAPPSPPRWIEAGAGREPERDGHK
jgi:hypothetical protein